MSLSRVTGTFVASAFCIFTSMFASLISKNSKVQKHGGESLNLRDSDSVNVVNINVTKQDTTAEKTLLRSELTKVDDQPNKEVAVAQTEQNSADSIHLKEYMDRFLGAIGSIAFERSNTVTQADLLEDYQIKMVCNRVKVSSVKNICDSHLKKCFLENQYDLFFKNAETLENQLLLGNVKCADGEYADAI